MEMRAGCPYFPETVSLDLLTVKRTIQHTMRYHHTNVQNQLEGARAERVNYSGSNL